MSPPLPPTSSSNWVKSPSTCNSRPVFYLGFNNNKSVFLKCQVMQKETQPLLTFKDGPWHLERAFWGAVSPYHPIILCLQKKGGIKAGFSGTVIQHFCFNNNNTRTGRLVAVEEAPVQRVCSPILSNAYMVLHTGR